MATPILDQGLNRRGVGSDFTEVPIQIKIANEKMFLRATARTCMKCGLMTIQNDRVNPTS